jgi:hypothetical protein
MQRTIVPARLLLPNQWARREGSRDVFRKVEWTNRTTRPSRSMSGDEDVLAVKFTCEFGIFYSHLEALWELDQ